MAVVILFVGLVFQCSALHAGCCVLHQCLCWHVFKNFLNFFKKIFVSPCLSLSLPLCARLLSPPPPPLSLSLSLCDRKGGREREREREREFTVDFGLFCLFFCLFLFLTSNAVNRPREGECGVQLLPC